MPVVLMPETVRSIPVQKGRKFRQDKETGGNTISCKSIGCKSGKKMKYLVFLRAVNVGGKNKVPMADLKKLAEAEGFCGVQTYLNSGNIILESDDDAEKISRDFVRILKNGFDVETENLVISAANLERIMEHAPDWWTQADKSLYTNLILLMPTTNFEELREKIGEPSPEIERIEGFDNGIFWAFDLKDYQKANWWKKTAEPGVNRTLTIRTANTIRKLLEKN